VKTPVVLLTGYLGSGKTTLLSRLLSHPDMGETAVIVNELGEAAIDHHLLRRVDERTVVLGNGCVCCTLRGDLADELRDLLSRRDRGEIPGFGRVVIETTGLADPAPILYTLLADPVAKHHFELERVVTTVDAQHGLRGEESLKQAAVADRLVVTKTDLADPVGVERELRRLNPGAEIVEGVLGNVTPRELFDGNERDPRDLVYDETAAHEHDVRAVCLTLDEQVDWTAFGIWLTMLLQARGSDVLRVKGLLDVGAEGPLLINGVQHVVHPPEHLSAWPDDDRRSRIVFIGRGFTREELERSLAAFNGAAKGSDPGRGLTLSGGDATVSVGTGGQSLVRARHPEHVLADEGEHEVVRHRRDRVEPRLPELPLDVVLLGEAEAAVRVQAGVRRRP
jgi:G3E family GTPase